MSEGKRVVVIGMDGSDDAEKALNFYLTDVHREHDELVVIHCVHHATIYTYQSVWVPSDPSAVSAAFEAENRSGDEICQKIENKLKQHKVQGRVLKLNGGDPGHAVVHKADELGASAIVVGCRGMGTVRRTLIGSVSDYIIHHAKCPVFVCRH